MKQHKVYIITRIHRGLLCSQEGFLNDNRAGQRFSELCKELNLPEDDPIGDNDDVYLEEVEVQE